MPIVSIVLWSDPPWLDATSLAAALVVGRRKILRLSDTPNRIYVPNEDIIRAEAID